MNEKLQVLIAEYEWELDFLKGRYEALMCGHDELCYIASSQTFGKIRLLQKVLADLKALQ